MINEQVGTHARGICRLTASPAFAASYSGTCTTAAKVKWMTEAAAQAKITEAGYTVASIKTTRAGRIARVDRAGLSLFTN